MRRSTTRAVVYSMVFIVITDFVLTRALLYVLGFSI
jgi:ABC-type transporter Mla maintaining outer membrane lipid asymmetry permease subunit MlaE